jgi:ribosomal protein S18
MLIRHSLLKFGKHQLAFNNKWVYKNFSNKINDDFQIKSTGFSKVATPQEAKVNLTEKFKIKLMDKEEKERRSQILKREITDNPEFFNAFPHLKQIVKREDMEDNQVDIQKHISDNYFIKEEDKNKDIKQKKSSYFESLVGSYKSYEDVLKTDRGDIDNVNTFAEGYKSLSGPMKYMSKREKEAVHLEIDKKLQELEDTGLSREEILYDKPEGTPLKEDKFFQYVKNNKIAREILVKPSETFTSDLIVEKILKQDIGPDGSLALKHKNFKFGDDMPAYYEVSKYKQHYSPKNKDSILQEDDFDYKTNYLDKLKLQVGSDRAKPVSFVNPPMAKSELRKKFMIKTIKKKDITWKNLPLLVRFVNEGGKLLNKYQTRLPTAIHRKLTKTVKHARNMGLLPFTDFVKPYHKVPFTSLYNEFAHNTSKVVDKNTGIIKVVHQPSEKDKYTYSSYDSAVEAESHYSAG